MPSAPKHRCTGAPTCPAMLPMGVRYCPDHAREYEARRGSRQERGYDAAFDRARARYAARLAAGAVLRCWRCGKAIVDGDAWDLGHDGPVIRGPQCLPCNRGDGGRRGAAAARRR